MNVTITAKGIYDRDGGLHSGYAFAVERGDAIRRYAGSLPDKLGGQTEAEIAAMAGALKTAIAQGDVEREDHVVFVTNDRGAVGILLNQIEGSTCGETAISPARKITSRISESAAMGAFKKTVAEFRLGVEFQIGSASDHIKRMARAQAYDDRA